MRAAQSPRSPHARIRASSGVLLGIHILWIFGCITTHGVPLSPNSGSFFNSRRSHLIPSFSDFVAHETYDLAPQAVATDVELSGFEFYLCPRLDVSSSLSSVAVHQTHDIAVSLDAFVQNK
ncbi:hypothetical protein C8R45DRAFT_1098273 [Mycena sanguinolenta]|nr:hypothetical protein C8R45DRAFT_1098273 [Mycena sanguinolenta]